MLKYAPKYAKYDHICPMPLGVSTYTALVFRQLLPDRRTMTELGLARHPLRPALVLSANTREGPLWLHCPLALCPAWRSRSGHTRGLCQLADGMGLEVGGLVGAISIFNSRL